MDPQSADFLARFPRPWVVVDWNILRGLARGRGLPGAFTAIIDDRLFREVMKSENPSAFLDKLNDVLLHPTARGRVLISRHPDLLWEPWGSPHVFACGSRKAIALDSSADFFRHQRDGDVFDPAAAAHYIEPSDDREEFELFTQSFLPWVRDKNPDALKQIKLTPHLTRQRLRQLALDIPEILQSLTRQGKRQLRRYRHRLWRDRLEAYPPITYIGRRLLLTAAYAEYNVHHEGRGQKRLSNDYDDSHYAATSLYVGRLCSMDDELKKVVSDVSDGSVRIFSSLDEVR